MSPSLSQKQVIKTEPQVIAPGEIAQLTTKSPVEGRLKGFVVGEGARPVKLWAGKEKLEIPQDGERPTINMAVAKGGLILLTVENVSDEPAVFMAAFALESAEQVAELVPTDGLTQKLPPEPTVTPTELGVKAGKNEIAVCFTRNEAQFLIEHLRTGIPLEANVKYGAIRRLDAALKVKG